MYNEILADGPEPKVGQGTVTPKGPQRLLLSHVVDIDPLLLKYWTGKGGKCMERCLCGRTDGHPLLNTLCLPPLWQET